MDIKAPKPKCKDGSPFKIKGNDAAEAIKSLDANGCWGRCDWKLDWDWSDKNKVVTEVILKPTSTITMPNWPKCKDLDAAKKKEWDAMIKCLKKHEDQHFQKFVDWYNTLPKALEKLGDCSGKKVDDFLNKAIDKHKKTQKDFDKSSKNGANDGVKFSA